tara:strand:- start:1548 stop:1769 length:222 start_codon:yes stop_codon:yes gene_type:complete
MSPTRVTIVTMDYPSLNLTAEALLATSVAYVVVSVALALLLYGVVRVAVARGIRDHHRWLEKNRNKSRDWAHE